MEQERILLAIFIAHGVMVRRAKKLYEDVGEPIQRSQDVLHLLIGQLLCCLTQKLPISGNVDTHLLSVKMARISEVGSSPNGVDSFDSETCI